MITEQELWNLEMVKQEIEPDNSALKFAEEQANEAYLEEVKQMSQYQHVFVRNENLREMEEIIIPDGTEEIGMKAFEGYEKLKRVVIPEGVKIIQSDAFYSCYSLIDIKLPESLEKIGECAFSNCENLKKITIPENVKEIEEAAFAECYSLEEVELPEEMDFLGAIVFAGCCSLEEIKIHKVENFINEEAFNGCSALRKVKLPENTKYILKKAFKDCSELEEIYIPDSVESIDEEAFKNCISLKKVSIPNGAKISNSAFSGCNDLELVYKDGSKVTKNYDVPIEDEKYREKLENKLNSSYTAEEIETIKSNMAYILKSVEENKTPSATAEVLGLNYKFVSDLYINCGNEFKESERVTNEMLEKFIIIRKDILDKLLKINISSYKSNLGLNISENKLFFIICGLRENIMPSILAETINVDYDVICDIANYYNKNSNKSNKEIVDELVKRFDTMEQQNKIAVEKKEKEEFEKHKQFIDDQIKQRTDDFWKDLFS